MKSYTDLVEHYRAECNRQALDYIRLYNDWLKLHNAIKAKAPIPDRCEHDVHGTDCFKCFPISKEVKNV